MKNIIIVGDKYAGKSSFMNRLTNNEFSASYIHSLWTSYDKYENVNIFDSVDSNKFMHANDTYYKIADGAVIIVDVTKKEAFDSVERWKHKILRLRCQNIPIMIVGNKIDQCKPEQKDHVAYISCKSNVNVKQSFDTFIEKVQPHPTNISVSVWTWIASWIPEWQALPYHLEHWKQIVMNQIPQHVSNLGVHE